jgi:arabinosaccharide transport system substrate-binding protein
MSGSHVLSRRALLGTTAGLLGAALVAACGGGGAPAAAPTPASQQGTSQQQAGQPAPQAAQPSTKGQVELEVWAHWDQGVQWLIDAMKHYNFPNPNITIKKVVYPFDEVHNKMLAACNSGSGLPDIMRVEQGRMSAFLRGEACFVDLKPLIGDKLKDLVLGSAVDYWSWKGKIYGIGDEMNACALAVRKTVFDDAGIKTPDGSWDDVAADGKTPFDSWQHFREAAATLKEKKNMAAIAWHDQSDGDFQMLLYAAGGLMFDENGEFGGANDLGVSILMMMHDMLHKDKTAIPAPVTGDQTWSSPVYWEAFRSGKVAATIGAPWHIGNLGQDTAIGPSQKGEWRLQRLPTGFGANKRTATHGGTSVSIPAGAQYRDEAWQVIEFTHLTKAVLEDFHQRGIMVTYKPALADPEVQKAWDYYGGESIGGMYSKIAEDMPRIYQSPWAPEIHTAFQNDVITPILRDPNAGEKEIRDAFAKLKADIERIKKQ